MTAWTGKSLPIRLILVALVVAAAVLAVALPALADHESTHLRCPNDPTRFTPDCAAQATQTATTLPKTAGADGEFAIIGLALIGIGVGLQRRWALSRQVTL